MASWSCGCTLRSIECGKLCRHYGTRILPYRLPRLTSGFNQCALLLLHNLIDGNHAGRHSSRRLQTAIYEEEKNGQQQKEQSETKHLHFVLPHRGDLLGGKKCKRNSEKCR